MDFGKKGDAKKAMKLKWKEGISLKEAWKRVQKKTSKKDKKDKKLSPKKKKSLSNAKKAMKLKWKEDISLKEAWKRVKDSKKSRFGDTVCPQGYEPNKKWTGKRGQQLCVKECGFYQMRDPETNRCRNMQMVKTSNGEKKILEVPEGYEFNEETGRLRKKCLPGQYRDRTSNRCKKYPAGSATARMFKTVPPGMEINEETGHLRKICDPGYYRDPFTGRCRKIKTDLEPLIAPPFGGATLMDFGGRYRGAKHRGSYFGNLPANTGGTAFTMKKNARGHPLSSFGKKCGFGSCASCNLN